MALTNGFPSGSTSTSTTTNGSVSGAAAVLTSYLYDNGEIDVTKLYQSRNSLFSLITNLGRGVTGNYGTLGKFEKLTTNYPEYKWQTKKRDGYEFAMGAAALIGDTTLTLASTTGLYSGCRLMVTTTNEVVTVSSVTNATQIVVTRGPSPAAIANSVALLHVGTAVGVGVASTTFVGAVNDEESNYIQHFVTTVTLTDKDLLANKVGMSKKEQIDDLLADKLITHGNEIERATLFGQKQLTSDASGRQVYTMNGIKEYAIRGWTADISSGLTAQILEDTLAFPLRYTKDGSNTKILLCGSKVKSRISALYSGQVRTENINEIDLTVQKVSINSGDYILVSHPFMDSSSGDWQKCALVIDPAFVEVVYPTGVDLEKTGFDGKTALIYNQSASTYANQVLDISTYLTIAVKNVLACGAIKVVA